MTEKKAPIGGRFTRRERTTWTEKHGEEVIEHGFESIDPILAFRPEQHREAALERSQGGRLPPVHPLTALGGPVQDPANPDAAPTPTIDVHQRRLKASSYRAPA